MIPKHFQPCTLNKCCIFIFYFQWQECSNLQSLSEENCCIFLSSVPSFCSRVLEWASSACWWSLMLLSIYQRQIYPSIFSYCSSGYYFLCRFHSDIFQFLSEIEFTKSGGGVTKGKKRFFCHWNVFTEHFLHSSHLDTVKLLCIEFFWLRFVS